MASRAGKHLSAGHTAGIYATTTLDGPEIGTLVAVVDRARNLPNRKTMGKQDPYCAMRLGKEAKKTGTDRRGGQTPKWDQELRFTVYDSSDYYKLKCSVFNDDKKTDMIGEAWIDLNGVLVPGGGQNDLWHQLSFKGKYAGEIRMELTYYDTRPKQESDLEKSRERERPHRSKVQPEGEDGSGSRKLGPREVKRRPLPADPIRPTPHQSHSAPLPQPYQDSHDSWSEHNEQWAPDSRLRSSPHPEEFQGQGYHIDPLSHEDLAAGDFEYDVSHQPAHSTHPYHSHGNQQLTNDPAGHSSSDDLRYQPSRSSYPSTPSHSPHHQTPSEREHRHSVPLPDASHSRTSLSPRPAAYESSPPVFSHDRYSPGAHDDPGHASFRRYSTSPIKNDVFRDSPLRQSVSQLDIDDAYTPAHDMHDAEDDLPPPPPAHRSSMGLVLSRSDEQQDVPPVAVPRPLNVGSRSPHASPFDRSPLQSIERNYTPERQTPSSNSPLAGNGGQYLPYRKPTYVEVDQSRMNEFHDRPNSGIENVSPSPVAGSNRNSGRIEDWHSDQEQQHGRQEKVYTQSQGGQNTYARSNGSLHHQGASVEEHQYTTSPSPKAGSVPRRKAVSPKPPLSTDTREMTDVPFGPDSYDVFNPSSPLSSSVLGPETRYDTPEQAREIARQHEVQKLRDQGPIIGNDGRVIDPSDHLPADTWAPEPTRKTRKPEVVIRYKTKEANPRTPQKYGTSPGSGRPHSFTGPLHGSSPISGESPFNASNPRNGRSRLQKQVSARPLPAQPYQQVHSSPAVPLAKHNTPSPRSSQLYQPEFPHHLQHSPHSFSDAPRGSPGYSHGRPPPIPDKVPVSTFESSDRVRGHGPMDALSAEMSTIDIDAGYSGRGTRSRRAYGQ